MSRLQHSQPAYLRLMQMSSEVLYVFVEGPTDRYVYSRITDYECQKLGMSYKIVTAEEVPDGTGGKMGLLKFFNFLKLRACLIHNFKGKTTICIFFLDKDIDDFLGTKRKSEHLVYTRTYELENYLFIHGDLTEAAAASASLDIGAIRIGLGDYAEWRRKVAMKWKEWVKLCLFSQIHGIQSAINYGCKSRVNKELCGPLDPNKCEKLWLNLERKSSLPSGRFKVLFAQISQIIDRMYREDQHDLIFKGKWYACFLAYDIGKIADRRRFQPQRLEKRLLTTLAHALNLDGGWTHDFRSPIRKLAARASKLRNTSK